MRYIQVPTELRASEIRANGYRFAPGRYSRFVDTSPSGATWFAPLDKLVVLRESPLVAKRSEWYHYAEIGDIDVSTGDVTFRRMRGYQLPDKRPLRAHEGDLLISTVRTYRKGIGYVSIDAENAVTTHAVMNVCGVTDFAPNLTMLYLYSFLRSDFLVEQIWSALDRGLYPRLDRKALNTLVIPIASDSEVITYVSSLMQAIIDKTAEIGRKNEVLETSVTAELERGQRQDTSFAYAFPTISEVRSLTRLDTGMYDREFKRKHFMIGNYEHGATDYNGLD